MSEIQEYLLKSEFTTDNSIVSYLLSPEDNNKIEVLLKEMKYMDSITKALQSEKTDLSDVRVLFDNVNASLTSYLGAEAKIVRNPSFESALVKIQDRKFEALTDAEQYAAKCLKFRTLFKRRQPTTIRSTAIRLNLCSKNGKWKNWRHRKMRLQRFQIFITNFEHYRAIFFSTAGYAFNEHRQNLTPMNLEMQLFLRMNKDFWDTELVTQIC